MREGRLVTPRRFRRRFQNTETRPRPPVTHALAQDRSSQSELRGSEWKTSRPGNVRMRVRNYNGTTIKKFTTGTLHERKCVTSRGSSAHSVQMCSSALTRHIFSQRPQIEGYQSSFLNFLLSDSLYNILENYYVC